MNFFIPCIPPTTTQQEHKISVRNGKPFFYEPAELKKTRQFLLDGVAKYRPEQPIVGPIRLHTKWIWPGETTGWSWKTTKPDTDNLIKLLKDCMTRAGFWNDDAQVASETTEKFRSYPPGIYVEVIPIDES